MPHPALGHGSSRNQKIWSGRWFGRRSFSSSKLQPRRSRLKIKLVLCRQGLAKYGHVQSFRPFSFGIQAAGHHVGEVGVDRSHPRQLEPAMGHQDHSWLSLWAARTLQNWGLWCRWRQIDKQLGSPRFHWRARIPAAWGCHLYWLKLEETPG